MRANRLDEARILLEGALAHARAYELPAPTIRASNNLAVVYESADRYSAAYEAATGGLEVARRVGDRVWESVFLAGPISALALTGRWDEATARVPRIEEVLPTVRGRRTRRPCSRSQSTAGEATSWKREPASRSPRGSRTVPSRARTGYRYHEAHILRAEGKPREALEVLEPNLASSDLGITFLTIKLSVVEALEAAFALGDSDRIEELVAMIESLRPGERPPLLDAHARRFRAKLSGDEAGFEAAADRFRKLEMPFWLAVTELEHAELLAEQGRETEAESLLGEAREIFERLEAKPWLERATALGSEPQAQVPA